MAGLRVDYEGLADAAGKLADQGDIFEDCIEAMTKVIDSLPDLWEAETCDKYVEQYGDYKSTFDDIRQLIQDMSEQMTQASGNYQDTDTGMRDQLG